MTEYQDYSEYSREGKKIGALMLIQQGVFQVGTVIVVIVIITAYLVLQIIKGGFHYEPEMAQHLANSSAYLIIVYLASDIMQLLAGIVFLVFYNKNKDIIRNAPLEGGQLSVKLILKAMLYVFAVNAVVTGASYFRSLIAGRLPTKDVVVFGTTGEKILIFLLVSIFPAIVEELLFRGVLFRYLRRHGFMYAALISSLIFGLIHMNLDQLIFASIMGFVFCYVYEKSGHIWPCMMLHFINNGCAMLMSFVKDRYMLIIPVLYLGFNALGSLLILFFFVLRPKIAYDRIAVKRTLTAAPMLVLLILGGCICLFRFVLGV